LIDPVTAALIIMVAIIIAVFAWYLIPVLWKKPVTGAESLIDAKGVVYSDTLAPDGEVSIDGVVWKARLYNPAGEELRKGDRIRVRKLEELTLMVERSN
jgi:membrane protein implicated in regulation of membrane protease activity